MMFLSLFLPFAVIFYARLIAPHHLCLKWRILGAIGCVLISALVSLAMPVSLQLARNKELYESLNTGAWLPWLYYIMVFMCPLLVGIIMRDFIWLGAHIWHFFQNRRLAKRQEKAGHAEDSVTSDEACISDGQKVMGRREFLRRVSTGATVGGALLVTPYAVLSVKRNRVIKQISVSLPNFPEELDGLRIVHLSDIHVGNTIFEEDIARIVEETNAQNPDIIAITGDMADGYPEIIGSWLNPMRNFKAKYGTWFVTGNHDHLWDGKGWCDVIRNLGIHVLDNEHEMIDIHGIPFAVAGAIDAGGDRKNRKWKSDPEKALANIAPGVFRLMLVHKPASVDRSFAAGADLVLLGHTHGGQCWPLNYLIDSMHKYARGLYEVGGRAAFVSCGTGYWGPPLRIGVPSEICVLTLHPKNPAA